VKEYTQEELNSLISCPKIIIEPPKKEMKLERGHLRNQIKLRSKEGEYDFDVFMRILEAFQENFSVGLVYKPKDEPGSFVLFRCNGPHGPFTEISGELTSHFKFHIHRAKKENIEQGLLPEKGGDHTETYASYLQALSYFLKAVNVINADEYFPDIQLPLGLN